MCCCDSRPGVEKDDPGAERVPLVVGDGECTDRVLCRGRVERGDGRQMVGRRWGVEEIGCGWGGDGVWEGRKGRRKGRRWRRGGGWEMGEREWGGKEKEMGKELGEG